MQAIIEREDLGLISKIGSNPPSLNGWAKGEHGERAVSAEEVIAELAYKIARAMIKESKLQINYGFMDE